MDSKSFKSYFTSPFPTFPFPTDDSDTDQSSQLQATLTASEDWEVSPLPSQSSTQNFSPELQESTSASALPPLPSNFVSGAAAYSKTPQCKEDNSRSRSPHFRVPGKPVSQLVAETSESHVSRSPTHLSSSRTPSLQTSRTPQFPHRGGNNYNLPPDDHPARFRSVPPSPRGANPMRFPKKLIELQSRLKQLKAQLAAVKNENEMLVSTIREDCTIFDIKPLNFNFLIITFLKDKKKEETMKELSNMRTRAAELGHQNSKASEQICKFRIYMEAIQEMCASFILMLSFVFESSSNYIVNYPFWFGIEHYAFNRNTRT